MTTSTFKTHLAAHPEKELRFLLPDGGFIPSHAHITEAGRLDKTFLDCGGTLRRTSACLLQAWVADDTDHRIPAKKLSAILALAEPLLESGDLEVEVEYQEEWISQFPVVDAQVSDEVLTFQLGLKHTDCLAKDICLPAAKDEEGCCSGSGCC